MRAKGLHITGGDELNGRMAHVVKDRGADDDWSIPKWFVAVLDDNGNVGDYSLYYSTRTQCFNAIKTDSVDWFSEERVAELLEEVGDESI